MGNHRDLAARIWRTIVCSGAMLGVPIVAAADAPDPTPPRTAESRPAPPAPDADSQRRAAIQRELDVLDARIDVLGQEVYKMGNTTSEPHRAAVAEYERLRAEREALTAAANLIGATPPVADVLQTLDQLRNAKTDPQRVAARAALRRQMEVRDLQARIRVATDEVSTAQSDAERAAAKTKLAALQKELAAKQADPAKRPRANGNGRPLGRGFILA
jgi:hypothetical protein